jgi:hypothetical protein
MTNASLIELNPTQEEKDFARRLGPRLKTRLQAFFIALVLTGMVLINGKYLSEHIEADPQSILFQLWPFNKIYLDQFVAAPYSATDTRWFYTVISCSNLIWLILLAVQFITELFRRDISFPRGKAEFLYHGIVRAITISAAMIALMFFVNYAGFEMLRDTPLNPSFKQSITVGAIKVALNMSFLYFAAAFFLESGALGLRYFFAKMLRCFTPSSSTTDDAVSGLPDDQTPASDG